MTILTYFKLIKLKKENDWVGNKINNIVWNYNRI